MTKFELLEAETREDLSQLITVRANQGWVLVSLHVTERSNGTPRYTVLLSKADDAREPTSRSRPQS